MRRVLLALLLILALTPGTCVYQTGGKAQKSPLAIEFASVPVPPRAEQIHHLGAFELEDAWSLTSSRASFGGYSALLSLPAGRLLAISDSARGIAFSPPGAPPAPPEKINMLSAVGTSKFDRDVEAATRDPATGTIWLAREYRNAISRHDAAFHTAAITQPPAMRDWGENTGPEAMARLSDGRFIVLEEGFAGLLESRRHRGLLFPRDPLLGGSPVRFSFDGAAQFSPTDMAQLPDGRVLVLMRRLVWPLPLRFAGRIVIADPATIRDGKVWHGIEVAKLSSSLPVDNFEGMAIEPRADGRVVVWLISDDNGAVTQRTMLWKLTVDPTRLPYPDAPGARKKARD